jgi:hypothetical protein
VPGHRPGVYYTVGMPTRRTTQRTVGVDDELWEDCMAIARQRRQRLSEVIRAALVEYRAEHTAGPVPAPREPRAADPFDPFGRA